jgi:hypothetical protein
MPDASSKEIIAMRFNMISGLVLLFCAGLSAVAAAPPETITGKVVSLSCYFQNPKNAGVPEEVCAHATIKYEAQPVGIVTADGKVYQLAGSVIGVNDAKMVPFIGKMITVTGTVSEKAGTPMLTSDEDAKLASSSQ